MAALEVLLLLTTAPGRPWRASEVAGTTWLPAAIARDELRDLAAAGQLDVHAGAEPTCSYGPRDARDHAAVRALARAWDEHQDAVLRYLSAQSIARVRSLAEVLWTRRR